MTLSIIIPVLNEECALPRLLAMLAPLAERGAQIIVADGGSTDRTRDAASGHRSVTVIGAPRGRALQMNAGARIATGDILLFLHADTLPPSDADALIRDALDSTGRVWGRFDVRIDGRARMLRVVAFFMNVRSRWSGIATGDQAIFVRRDAFMAVGGYPEQPIMEDIELSGRLLRVSRPACIARRVTTSGRRWEKFGVWQTIFLMWRLRWAYWLGAPAARLARDYK